MRLRFTMLTTREGRKHLENIPKLRSLLTRAVRRVGQQELEGIEELALNVILQSDDVQGTTVKIIVPYQVGMETAGFGGLKEKTA